MALVFKTRLALALIYGVLKGGARRPPFTKCTADYFLGVITPPT